MTADDKMNVEDLKQAIEALYEAVRGVEAQDQYGRDRFTWGIGVALGRLHRVRERFFPKAVKEKADAQAR
jgi:hypothetical protein